MKKFFLAILMAAMFMFASCEYNGNKTNEELCDSLEVVNDSITPTDTILVNVDTIHCVAMTKTGVQCKNHRMTGDTLCAIHKNLRK